MKRISIAFITSTLLLLTTAFTHAQTVVGWDIKSIHLKKNDSELQFTATVKAPWHIYSITSAEGGPAPMRFVFTKNPLIALDRKVPE